MACLNGEQHDVQDVGRNDGHGAREPYWVCVKCNKTDSQIRSADFRAKIERSRQAERDRVKALEAENAELKQRLAQRDRLLASVAEETDV